MDDLLYIDPVLVREAQQIASLRNINLCEAVEGFIRSFINEDKDKDSEIKITPWVARLGTDLGQPSDFDEKESYRNHLEEKHL